MIEQQQHLQQAIEEQKSLISEINSLNEQLNYKKEMVLKLQGIIEYLQQTGITLPEKNVADAENKTDDEEES
jgi:hypothetical protein